MNDLPTQITSNQRKRAVICRDEAEARELATGQYRAYRVTDATGRAVFVVAINPVLARGVAAEAFGVVAELLDRPARITKATLLAILARMSEDERRELLSSMGPNETAKPSRGRK